MIEKIVIGFIGAALALGLREWLEREKSGKRRKKISALCKDHLLQIKQDYEDHVYISDTKDSAEFAETQYCEVVVGDFLYDLITSNIDVFESVEDIQRTILFFHHYKVNMSTVRSRLDSSKGGKVYLTKGTYQKLLDDLNLAIEELDRLANT